MLALSVPAMADTGGAVLGALVLGALGNQIGGGNGKKIATVAGVMAGASIGSRLEDGTYGKDANGDYVCVNCGNQTAQQNNPGATGAAHMGAAEDAADKQCRMEASAYYSNGGRGRYRCNSGHVVSMYRNRAYNNGIQWR